GRRELKLPIEFRLSAEFRRNSPGGEFGVVSDKRLTAFMLGGFELPVGNSGLFLVVVFSTFRIPALRELTGC
ncbi:hypothetical protein, partial [Streptomyces mirabilis]|uniref:hypothetical protein n=1 Tax=Streptomyces mirabilis TaxID=68239 RepID=UPI003674C91F